MFFKASRAGLFASILYSASIVAFPSPSYAMETASIDSRPLVANEAVEIIVKGEEELSRSYPIDENGMIDMPMLGKISIAGENIVSAEAEITSRLKDGYINSPQVTVTLTSLPEQETAPTPVKNTNDKSVYIVGEVNDPGYYALPPEASHILNIIALAGGYTDSADKKEFEIVRNIDGVHYRKTAEVGALKYHDGDIIIIKERF